MNGTDGAVSPVIVCEQHLGKQGISDKNSTASARFSPPLQSPSETAGCTKLPINLEAIPDQGEKAENVIKPQVTRSLLFSVTAISKQERDCSHVERQ